LEYVNLGRSGLKVSRLCLGCMSYGSSTWREWVLDEEASRPFFQRALEHGINFFDTADVYSNGASEEVTGRAIRDFATRGDVVLATKCFYPTGKGPNDRGLSRKHIFDAVDASLRRLGTDYIDLYQVHRWDPTTPIDETLRALEDVVCAGKVLYIGASSCYAWELAQALALADARGWTRFVSMQNHYNLIYREEEREMIPLCRQEGLGIIPWSPLARGFLAGTRRKGAAGDTSRARTDDFAHQMYYQDTDAEIAGRCVQLAQKRGVPPAQVALAWLLHQPGVTAPIVGATKLEQLDQAAGAVDVKLTPEEMTFLEEKYQAHPVLGLDLLPRR
jgi:aryl-alcohol dehydrogenase (NADP+)